MSKLPPEFTRKGRIDEIYGVYLPTHKEQVEIFQIHMRLKRRTPGDFEPEALAAATGAYSGAVIEQVVITGLEPAFHAGAELSTDYMLQVVPEVRPLSQTDPEQVAAMTEWLDRHAKPAGGRSVNARQRTG